jgi:hypothetical protein
MVGFGYIEVSVHHMDARPGFSLIGATVWIKGPLSCFAAHLGSIFSKQHAACPALDVMRVRLDDGYPTRAGVMGIET